MSASFTAILNLLSELLFKKDQFDLTIITFLTDFTFTNCKKNVCFINKLLLHCNQFIITHNANEKNNINWYNYTKL